LSLISGKKIMHYYNTFFILSEITRSKTNNFLFITNRTLFFWSCERLLT